MDKSESLRAWRMVLTTVTVVLVTSIGACTVSGVHQRESMLEAIRAGADPMAASCAFTGVGEREHIICADAVRNGAK